MSKISLERFKQSIKSGKIPIKKRYGGKLKWFGELAVFGDYVLDSVTAEFDYKGVDKNKIKNFLNSNEFMRFCTPKLYPKNCTYYSGPFLADAAEAYIGRLFLNSGEKAVTEYILHNLRKYIE
jgi:dsRNA-specific ribonuclease